MKVWVINLARSPQRLAQVSVRLAELGVEWERFDAVDDAQLSPAERARGFSALGWWCCTLMPPARGQLGCALSHYGIYRRMLAEGLDKVCVLEDDVILDDRFPQALAWVDEHLDTSRPIVALFSDHDGHAGRVTLPGIKRELPLVGSRVPRDRNSTELDVHLEPSDWDWCAEGYVVTKAAARAMLKDNYPLRVMNDIWERWLNQGVIELFHVRPTVCSQRSHEHPEESEITRIPRICDWPFCRRLWWKCRRVVGVTLDALSSPRRFRGRCVQLLRKLH